MENKFCINCKYYSQKFPAPTQYCEHPDSLLYLNNVNGGKVFSRCSDMRDNGTCGKNATLFESTKKTTFWLALKNALLS